MCCLLIDIFVFLWKWNQRKCVSIWKVILKSCMIFQKWWIFGCIAIRMNIELSKGFQKLWNQKSINKLVWDYKKDSAITSKMVKKRQKTCKFSTQHSKKSIDKSMQNWNSKQQKQKIVISWKSLFLQWKSSTFKVRAINNFTKKY